MSGVVTTKPPGSIYTSTDSTVAWFCVRSQLKHEHIAAAHLAKFDDVTVFNPRIRFARSTRQGPVWVTESLFPNYLFARFNWKTGLSKVRYASGVSHVVHFGSQWPTIPDDVIAQLRLSLGKDEIHEIPPLGVGDTVDISGGVMHGLQGVITQVLPARERVKVLLDFLGRQTTVEVSVSAVVKKPVY